MTLGSYRRLPLSLALLALFACQGYNFTPVNQCLLQPGTQRVTISNISTADILFVVDDSGSMQAHQAALATSFDSFVQNLVATNTARVKSNLAPIDFHIAVTTTSVFLNTQINATCSNSCGANSGSLVCCDNLSGAPVQIPQRCAQNSDCTGGNSCSTSCSGVAGEQYCCNASGVVATAVEACQTSGAICGSLSTHYAFSKGTICAAASDCGSGATCKTGCAGLTDSSMRCCDSNNKLVERNTCNPGVATDGALYPQGDFVAQSGNPLVLHFTKDLFQLGADGQPTGRATLADLTAKFKANVSVGTCGSGQEQGLEAARLAISKALKMNGLKQPSGVADGEWPHANSKLVVVFVGDEDDCSSPLDPKKAIVLSENVDSIPVTTPKAKDTCEADYRLPLAARQGYPLSRYTDFLNSLNRPVAAAFIVSAVANDCVDTGCSPAVCCSTCSEQGGGYKFLDLAGSFRTRGYDSLAGSVCATGPSNTGFASVLSRVADVVKQPNGLKLATKPVSGTLTVVSIVGSNGAVRLRCSGPAPAAAAGAAVDDISLASKYAWWFTAGDDTDRRPTAPSQNIYLNRTPFTCQAGPGETYAVEYLGVVPPGGCLSDSDCNTALGASNSTAWAWTCKGSYVPSGENASQSSAIRGSCVCTAK